MLSDSCMTDNGILSESLESDQPVMNEEVSVALTVSCMHRQTLSCLFCIVLSVPSCMTDSGYPV